MRATAIYDLIYTDLLPARKRLLEAHLENRSWHKVAEGLRMNVSYVYNFAIHGRLPRNKTVCKKLLGHRSINEHLAGDLIQDMPAPLLAWSLENREEWKRS